jgi:hypothetical protein
VRAQYEKRARRIQPENASAKRLAAAPHLWARVQSRERVIRTPMSSPRRWIVAVVVVVIVLLILTAVAVAQRRGFGGGPRGPFRVLPNTAYDGRFTFVRVKYETAPGGYWYGGWPAWGHGHPIAEQNLMKIMTQITLLRAHDEEINTLGFDDPEILNYPIAYVIEVDWWMMTDREAAGLRAYMQKGGFVIVDDFKPRRFGGGEYGGGWDGFEENMKRVLPSARFVDLDVSHPIFHSFFDIRSLELIPQAYIAGRPIFRGIFEDNNPAKRLQMMVNYNTDVSQFWEWSGRGLRPVDETNEAYKLGVNYLIYGLTH